MVGHVGEAIFALIGGEVGGRIRGEDEFGFGGVDPGDTTLCEIDI
jgi:hypothetical protein